MMHLILSIDLAVLKALYAQREFHATLFFIDITQFGSTIFVCGIATCLALAFALRRKYAYIAGLVVSIGGSGAVALALKEIVKRARPDAFYQAYTETGFSFPSAHATLAAALYGFLIFIVWRSIRSRRWCVFIETLLVILIGTIALSRLYLGVHYFSDVVAGLAIGSAFAWLGTVVVKKLGRYNQAD